ncbi:MAG: hypothetical protein ABIG44_17780 [Planctomycetota bacterium]
MRQADKNVWLIAALSWAGASLTCSVVIGADVDLPANMRGAIFRVANHPIENGGTLAFNMKPTGTEEANKYSDVQSYCQTQALGPVNDNHEIDLLSEIPAEVFVYIEGYLTENVTFFDYPYTRIDFTTPYQWETIDVSGVPGMPADAKFVIVEADGPGTRPPVNNFNFRYKGATDERTESHSSGHSWSVVPLNSDKRFEVYIEDVNYCYMNIAGAVTEGQVRTTGGADLAASLERDGAWQTVDLSTLNPPADARYAVIEVFSPSTSLVKPYAVRPHNETGFGAIYTGNRDIGGFQLIPLVDNKFDIRMEAGSTMQLYCWGYVTGETGWYSPIQIPPDVFQGGGPQYATLDLDVIVAQGRRGDLDGNTDVDLDDFDIFSACLAGPNETGVPFWPGSIHFGQADLDGDADVDLVDFTGFQTVFTGPLP